MVGGPQRSPASAADTKTRNRSLHLTTLTNIICIIEWRDVTLLLYNADPKDRGGGAETSLIWLVALSVMWLYG